MAGQPRRRTAPLALPPARAAALDALARVVDKGVDAQAALDAALGRNRLSPADSGLCTEIFYGTLRLHGRLAWLTEHFLADPARLPAPVRRILVVAAFELTRLDRVPAYATLHWAVEAVKAVNPRLAGVANAVLRAVERLGPDASGMEFYRQGARSEAEFLSRFYACPEWLVRAWITSYGQETARLLLAAQIEAAPTGVRVNRARPGAEALAERLAADPACVWHDGHDGHDGYALAFTPGKLALSGDDFASGAASLQSAASQQALAALAPESWPTPVWDACCGRGGKTLSLAERGIAPLWASDTSLARLRGLPADARRLGLGPAAVFRARADQTAPLRRAPGSILIDAPCSGLGVLSRRPDAKLRRTPADVAALSRLQGQILRAAWRELAPGGRLAYVTCTLTPEENELVVDAFLRETPDARLGSAFATPADSPLREFFFARLLHKP